MVNQLSAGETQVALRAGQPQASIVVRRANKVQAASDCRRTWTMREQSGLPRAIEEQPITEGPAVSCISRSESIGVGSLAREVPPSA